MASQRKISGTDLAAKKFFLLSFFLFISISSGASLANSNASSIKSLLHEAEGGSRTALNQLERDARSGVPKAAVSMASYFHNNGHSKSSLYWSRRAADEGSSAGEFQLGVDRDFGIGITKNSERARYWYRLSAKRGYLASENNLASMDIESHKPKLQRRGVYWYRKASRHGYAAAQYSLGYAYMLGKGVSQNQRKGLYWITKAAHQNYPSAIFDLGLRYQNGDGVPKSEAKAYYWYRQGARLHDAPAMLNLGVCYAEGLGVKQSSTKAVAIWKQLVAIGGHYGSKAAEDIQAIEHGEGW